MLAGRDQELVPPHVERPETGYKDVWTRFSFRGLIVDSTKLLALIAVASADVCPESKLDFTTGGINNADRKLTWVSVVNLCHCVFSGADREAATQWIIETHTSTLSWYDTWVDGTNFNIWEAVRRMDSRKKWSQSVLQYPQKLEEHVQDFP